jgi:hypothetical protein
MKPLALGSNLTYGRLANLLNKSHGEDRCFFSIHPKGSDLITSVFGRGNYRKGPAFCTDVPFSEAGQRRTTRSSEPRRKPGGG